jgi:preprotein translocase subunit SecF
VALLLVWAGATADETRKWVHITGIAWVIACAAVAQQTIAGRSIFDVSPTMMVAVFVLVVWGGGVLFAFARWARPSRRPGELGTI